MARKNYSFGFPVGSTAYEWLEAQDNKTLSLSLAIDFLVQVYGKGDFMQVVMGAMANNVADPADLLAEKVNQMNQQPEPKQAAADTASEETATPVKQTPAAKTPSAPAPGKKKIDISMLSTERDS
ncbi:hypothetical protein [Limosilactobacillus mucosae]|uniref:hypothetical protein n=1 Tax=Limosilactobacillus mucosae TaxID=97478 RepID=UPI0022E71CE5|nr:hypothetical protein [Limosilactobacillus mucosae]